MAHIQKITTVSMNVNDLREAIIHWCCMLSEDDLIISEDAEIKMSIDDDMLNPEDGGTPVVTVTSKKAL